MIEAIRHTEETLSSARFPNGDKTRRDYFKLLDRQIAGEPAAAAKE